MIKLIYCANNNISKIKRKIDQIKTQEIVLIFATNFIECHFLN